MSSEEGIYGSLLFFRKTGAPGTKYTLSSGKTCIGSSDDADIRLKVTDGRLEGIHCIIDVANNGIATIINKSQTAPISVNSVTITKFKVLYNEDKVEVIGKYFQYFNKNITEKDVEKQQTLLNEVINTPRTRQSVASFASVQKSKTKKPSQRKSVTRQSISGVHRKFTTPDSKCNLTGVAERPKTTSKLIVSKSLHSPRSSKKRRLSMDDNPKRRDKTPKVSERNILLSEKVVSSTADQEEESSTPETKLAYGTTEFLDETDASLPEVSVIEQTLKRRSSMRTPSRSSVATKILNSSTNTPKFTTPNIRKSVLTNAMTRTSETPARIETPRITRAKSISTPKNTSASKLSETLSTPAAIEIPVGDKSVPELVNTTPPNTPTKEVQTLKMTPIRRRNSITSVTSTPKNLAESSNTPSTSKIQEILKKRAQSFGNVISPIGTSSERRRTEGNAPNAAIVDEASSVAGTRRSTTLNIEKRILNDPRHSIGKASPRKSVTRSKQSLRTENTEDEEKSENLEKLSSGDNMQMNPSEKSLEEEKSRRSTRRSSRRVQGEEEHEYSSGNSEKSFRPSIRSAHDGQELTDSSRLEESYHSSKLTTRNIQEGEEINPSENSGNSLRSSRETFKFKNVENGEEQTDSSAESPEKSLNTEKPLSSRQSIRKGDQNGDPSDSSPNSGKSLAKVNARRSSRVPIRNVQDGGEERNSSVNSLDAEKSRRSSRQSIRITGIKNGEEQTDSPVESPEKSINIPHISPRLSVRKRDQNGDQTDSSPSSGKSLDERNARWSSKLPTRNVQHGEEEGNSSENSLGAEKTRRLSRQSLRIRGIKNGEEESDSSSADSPEKSNNMPHISSRQSIRKGDQNGDQSDSSPSSGKSLDKEKSRRSSRLPARIVQDGQEERSSSENSEKTDSSVESPVKSLNAEKPHVTSRQSIRKGDQTDSSPSSGKTFDEKEQRRSSKRTNGIGKEQTDSSAEHSEKSCDEEAEDSDNEDASESNGDTSEEEPLSTNELERSLRRSNRSQKDTPASKSIFVPQCRPLLKRSYTNNSKKSSINLPRSDTPQRGSNEKRSVMGENMEQQAVASPYTTNDSIRMSLRKSTSKYCKSCETTPMNTPNQRHSSIERDATINLSQSPSKNYSVVTVSDRSGYTDDLESEGESREVEYFNDSKGPSVRQSTNTPLHSSWRNSSVVVVEDNLLKCTPENNTSIVIVDDTPLEKPRRKPSKTLNSSIDDSIESTTPKSALKGRRSKSMPYKPIVEDITPATPEETKNNTNTKFKTPMNTPGLFENIKKSALRSRSRQRPSSNLMEELKKAQPNKASKRPRDSSVGTDRSAKKRKMLDGNDSFETNMELDLDATFSSFASNEVLGSENSDDYIAPNTPHGFRNLTDKPLITDPQSKSLTEPRKVKPSLQRRSLQAVNLESEIEQNDQSNESTSSGSSNKRTSKRLSLKAQKEDGHDEVDQERKNNARNVDGLKKLLNTKFKSPKNDLRDVRGVKRLMRTPKPIHSPKNDLTNIIGVKKLLSTPKKQKEPRNDLRSVDGVKKLLSTPRKQNSPLNDLTKVPNLQRLMSPKQQKSPLNDRSNLEGVADIFAQHESFSNENDDAKENTDDLFDKLFVRKPIRTYRGRSLSPLTRKVIVYGGDKRRTLGDPPVTSPRIEKWLEDVVIRLERVDDGEERPNLEQEETEVMGRGRRRAKSVDVDNKTESKPQRLRARQVVATKKTEVESPRSLKTRQKKVLQKNNAVSSTAVEDTSTSKSKPHPEKPNENVEEVKPARRGRRRLSVRDEGEVVSTVEEKKPARRGRRKPSVTAEVVKIEFDEATEIKEKKPTKRGKKPSVKAEVENVDSEVTSTAEDEKPVKRVRGKPSKRDEGDGTSSEVTSTVEKVKPARRGRRKSLTKDEGDNIDSELASTTEDDKPVKRGRRNSPTRDEVDNTNAELVFTPRKRGRPKGVNKKKSPTTDGIDNRDAELVSTPKKRGRPKVVNKETSPTRDEIDNTDAEFVPSPKKRGRARIDSKEVPVSKRRGRPKVEDRIPQEQVEDPWKEDEQKDDEEDNVEGKMKTSRKKKKPDPVIEEPKKSIKKGGRKKILEETEEQQENEDVKIGRSKVSKRKNPLADATSEETPEPAKKTKRKVVIEDDSSDEDKENLEANVGKAETKKRNVKLNPRDGEEPVKKISKRKILTDEAKDSLNTQLDKTKKVSETPEISPRNVRQRKGNFKKYGTDFITEKQRSPFNPQSTEGSKKTVRFTVKEADGSEVNQSKGKVVEETLRRSRRTRK